MRSEISGLHGQRGSSSNVQEKFNLNMDCCKGMGSTCQGQGFYQRKLEKKHSRTARNNEIDFVLDSKIEYITRVHGGKQADIIDPHAEGMEIWPKAKKIRGLSASGR